MILSLSSRSASCLAPRFASTVAGCLLLALPAACGSAPPGSPGPATSAVSAASGASTAPGRLSAYTSEAELQQALERWRAEAARRRAEVPRQQPAMVGSTQGGPVPLPAPMPMAVAPAAAPAPMAKSAMADSAAAPASDGITNVQTAGVDEGGIVKRAGDFLVVLRRGRLFTLRIGGDALEAVAAVDAYAPDADPRGAWYDEMLVHDRSVVVVGYSYARGGTEIGLFDLDARGGLRYRATWHLRSGDYYSARNYASRLIGSQLVFYSPLALSPWGDAFPVPGLRRWDGRTAAPTDPSWQRLLPATRIFRTDDDFDPAQPLALHTVTRCELAATPLRCESTAVLGPSSRVSYVSQSSAWVWTVGRASGPDGAPSALFRLPLDGAAPSAIKTVGAPIDQLSFLEEAAHLNVVLRASGAGESMFGDGRGAGATALLRLPLHELGDGRQAAALQHYRRLPVQAPTQNRYVGDWLLLGSSRGPALALKPAEPRVEPQTLDPGHAVERIEGLGRHAVLVGNAGRDLVFSAVRLDGGRAQLAGRHLQPSARQGETRTHGFHYRPTGADGGLLGLPVVGLDNRPATVRSGGQGSAAVLFLRERALGFQPLGDLASQGTGADDGCRASCVDWYGNARPLFIGERVFALLGYELVEGRLAGRGRDERLDERRRVGFAPKPPLKPGERPSPFSQP